MHRRLARYPEALQAVDEALILAEGQPGLGPLHATKALTLIEQGNAQQALVHRRLAAELYLQDNDTLGHLRSLINEGNLLAQIGPPGPAEAVMRTAVLGLRSRPQGRASLSRALANLALHLDEDGRSIEAHPLCLEALALQRAEENRRDEATTLQILGGITLRLGRPVRALGLFDAAQALSPQHREGPRLAQILLGRAQVLRWLGRHDEALADLMDVLDTLGGLPRRVVVWCHTERGLLALAMGSNPDDALTAARATVGPLKGRVQRQVDRLERAVAAAKSGRRLVAGLAEADVPRTLQGWPRST
jgi:tetratricopeptide (TPR) repeat protein